MKLRLSFPFKSEAYHYGYVCYLRALDYHFMSANSSSANMGDRMAGWKDAEWDGRPASRRLV